MIFSFFSPIQFTIVYYLHAYCSSFFLQVLLSSPHLHILYFFYLFFLHLGIQEHCVKSWILIPKVLFFLLHPFFYCLSFDKLKKGHVHVRDGYDVSRLWELLGKLIFHFLFLYACFFIYLSLWLFCIFFPFVEWYMMQSCKLMVINLTTITCIYLFKIDSLKLGVFKSTNNI